VTTDQAPLRTGYHRLARSTAHEHTADGAPVTHDHSAGATRHWHEAGSGAPEFGPEPVPEGQPRSAVRMLLEVRECALCLGPAVYWDGQFLHLTAECPGFLLH
jgi:hypothetical protein